ncbi:hypothetical protein N566_24710 [Streptomycetaceae bacterium MP113-05]|nr:hypothetical protein N566_24710 [Streptomycetaceae bacterium MP113-05]
MTSPRPLADRYRLGEQLGHGGAAQVYRAADLRCRRRPVAVKIFRPGDTRAVKGGCRQEARMLRRLRHPGLVTLYEANPAQERPFLVLQLIDGGTLRRRIEDDVPLSPHEAAHLGEPLAHALSHVHRAGIAHCDIKPGNILLDATGRPHLVDFGVARVLADGAPVATDRVPGTAAYLAPEQVRGEEVTTRTDVYALGLTLLESLTGCREYAGGPLEAALARLHRPPTVPDRIPEELADLLIAMTSATPGRRPPARQCAQRLSAFNRRTPAAAPCTG